jgi:hypothetical protein
LRYLGMKLHRIVLVAILALVTFTSLDLRAQDVATSEALFQKGLDDMEAGKLETACPAFAESLRMDPRAGTLFTLAECYAKDGKTASAVTRYEEYLLTYSRMTADQQAKQVGREKVAAEQRDRLKPTVPRLTIRLEEGSPADTIVKRDDTVLNGPSLGIPLPVDPGEHTVSAQIPGGPVTTQTFQLAAGEQKEITLKVEVATTTTVSTTTAGRLAGIALGGTGLAGLIVGAIAGGVVLGTDLEGRCDLETKQCADAEALEEVERAQTIGIVSTVGFVAGGAMLATGLVVFFTAPSGGDTEQAVSHWRFGVRGRPEGGFLDLTASF